MDALLFSWIRCLGCFPGLRQGGLRGLVGRERGGKEKGLDKGCLWDTLLTKDVFFHSRSGQVAVA